MMNSLDFKAFRLYNDSTLKSMNKDELISYIHMLHHNWGACDERLRNVIDYQEQKREVLQIEVYDKETNTKHIVGTDVHDCLLVEYGKVKYYNLQNGESTDGDYEFVEKRLFDEIN